MICLSLNPKRIKEEKGSETFIKRVTGVDAQAD
jgi:hypothetical protein